MQFARHQALKLHSSNNHQHSPCYCPHVRTLFCTTHRQRHSSVAHAATQAQQQVLAVPYPPQGYDYKAEILDETVDVVGQQYPQLMDLVEQGGSLAKVPGVQPAVANGVTPNQTAA
jgi:hypothetical protein